MRKSIFFVSILAVLLGFVVVSYNPAEAQSPCTLVGTRTITTEISLTTTSSGITIAEVLAALDATRGQRFEFISAGTYGISDANGMAEFLTVPEVGMIQDGMRFYGVFDTVQYPGQLTSGVNGGSTTNPVTVNLCAEYAGNTRATTTTTTGTSATVTNPAGTWLNSDSWAWLALTNGARAWCDGYQRPFDGSLNGANALANTLAGNDNVAAAIVITNQVSTRLGSNGVTILEVTQQLGATDGDVILLIPSDGFGICLAWWLAGVQVGDNAFTFVYNHDATIAGLEQGQDRDFVSFTEINGGNADNPVVAVRLTLNMDNMVTDLLED